MAVHKTPMKPSWNSDKAVPRTLKTAVRVTHEKKPSFLKSRGGEYDSSSLFRVGMTPHIFILNYREFIEHAVTNIYIYIMNWV